MADPYADEFSAEHAPKAPLFLQLSSRDLNASARNKKLKAGDVLVAVDGQMFNGDTEMLRALLGGAGSYAEDKKDGKKDEADETANEPMPHLLTFWRGGNFFHIIFERPLTCGFENCPAEEAVSVASAFRQIKFSPLELYQNFEVYRDVHKRAALHSTDHEPIAKYAPLLWMMNHRLYYPMVGIGIGYLITFLVHWSLFVLTYLLTSVYTNRAQINLLRSYKLFEDKFFWMIVAETSETQARATCRKFSAEIKFDFEPVQKPPKKAANSGRLRVDPSKIAPPSGKSAEQP